MPLSVYKTDVWWPLSHSGFRSERFPNISLSHTSWASLSSIWDSHFNPRCPWNPKKASTCHRLQQNSSPDFIGTQAFYFISDISKGDDNSNFLIDSSSMFGLISRTNMYEPQDFFFKNLTLQGTNISHQWKRKLIFPTTLHMGYVSLPKCKIHQLGKPPNM